MSDLTPAHFGDLFEAIHGEGRRPFPWQMRLAERVCSAPWPAVLALPTASGKTACIEIALFSLACQADQAARTAPRRVFFVVDRRVIVDQAFRHAVQIARKLEEAEAGILREVADRLRRLARSDRPVSCFQLRGGIYRDDAWARTPLQPTVIASTVDQIGSRLLFRGYGLRSGAASPVHAGLAGNDSLVLLDEAHCARPFGQTADAIRRYRGWGSSPLASPFHLVQMTATPPADVADSEILADEQEDRDHPVLGRRIRAAKPATLIVAEKARGKDWQRHLAAELAGQAHGLMKEPVQAVGVIVNRVTTARAVADLLREKHGARADVVLLTGRMRPLDRDRVVDRWLRQLESGSATPLERPVFVVATQCLEVGADLDFHALVSECASLDALRQRFGRLNRVAARDFTPARIVVRADQTQPAPRAEDEDPVYGNSLAHTWQWLCAHATDGTIDMGIRALQRNLDQEEPACLAELNAPSPEAPTLFPSHLDCWAQTSPVPSPEPEPALFLHGPGTSLPDVQVVWRADLVEEDLPREQLGERWREIVSLCPPSSAEAMPVPLGVFRRWLAGTEEKDSTSDVEGERALGEEPPPARGLRHALRWLGPDSDDTGLLNSQRDPRPGDTLVLPASGGGWEVFGHIPGLEDPQGSRGIDLGDEAFQHARDLALVRLTPEVVLGWEPNARATLLQALRSQLQLLAPSESSEENDQQVLRQALIDLGALLEEPDVCMEVIDNVLAALASMEGPTWLRLAAGTLRNHAGRIMEPHPGGGLILRGRARLHVHEPSALLTDEDDTASALESGTSGGGVLLEKHCAGVERKARLFAEGCGLAPRVVEALGWAGRWHDLGKADRRFQALLRCLPRRAVAAGQPLLAKSEATPRSAMARRLARERSGYPAGGRHELLSVRLVEGKMDRLPAGIDRELLLHLIGSHHGRCRPFAPVIEDIHPEEVPPFVHHGETFSLDTTQTQLERVDSGVAERFWLLVRRYGWWGLAYLEAILRLADHRQSEEEQTDGKEQ